MEAYRYQELAYLIVPVMVGMEFFMTAKAERRGLESPPVGTYVLDFFGFVFAALIPAIFAFTIWSIETSAFDFGSETLARFDRYAVMFLFMGAWWQVYILGALRVRRARELVMNEWYVWLPFLVLGTFISLLVLWVSPWGLKWISVIWFFAIFGILKLLGAGSKIIEKVFWVLALTTFLFENLLFIWLETLL